ncbi:6beafb9a-e8e9-4397-a739-8dcd564b53b3 [Sclerotinia trifoliorum]|uniref:6beafb9a-e8e9-4397-a739-8dcd564b53b3 n=1 Tax=Sclerotinia trifoliorum TaxID=28548 RepID=A0A8H2ZU88_9HELO|nr:6beafb9a-e8e9-4397-a739-8dcd564b53b3 [Sclerotinia trifoliorum]
MVQFEVRDKTIAMVSISTTGARSILSGALFGASLTAAGVYSPTVIISQMKLESFHMLKVFLSASATSAAVFLLAHRLSPTLAPPRQASSLSLFPYDGNLIGGLLLGIGMALTGACPGTVLPQVVTGYQSGRFAFVGAIIGAIIYSKIRPFIRTQATCSAPTVPDAKPTLYQKLDPKADEIKAVYIYQNFCWGIILLASWLSKDQVQSLLTPTWGGICIGCAQGASLWLTENTLGASSAYEQLGDLFWSGVERLRVGDVVSDSSKRAEKVYGNRNANGYLNGNGHLNGNGNGATKPPLRHPSTARPSIRGNFFTFGILLGSYLLSRTMTLPTPLPITSLGKPNLNISELSTSSMPSIPIPRAILGGIAMVLGARIAGGCTSGHGISGMSLLSVSSIISVCAMFGGGIFWGVVVG